MERVLGTTTTVMYLMLRVGALEEQRLLSRVTKLGRGLLVIMGHLDARH